MEEGAEEEEEEEEEEREEKFEEEELQEEMADIAVPSKLYGVMAVARPVVMVGPARSEPGCWPIWEPKKAPCPPRR